MVFKRGGLFSEVVVTWVSTVLITIFHFGKFQEHYNLQNGALDNNIMYVIKNYIELDMDMDPDTDIVKHS